MEVILALVGVVLGWLLTEISTRIRSSKDEKERFLLANIQVRQQAYANLYTALIELQYYFRGFMDIKSEFVEKHDVSAFAPLSSFTKFEKELKSNEIWIHEESKKLLDDIATSTLTLCNLGLSIALSKFNQEPLANYYDSVERESDRMYDFIEDAKAHIRSINGLYHLDKHNSKIIKKAP